MKAFLLAAGKGTRLKPLTDSTPKCLLPIQGRPLLGIWLELLKRHGIVEVLINTHWHAEKVQHYLEQGGWPCFFRDRDQPGAESGEPMRPHGADRHAPLRIQVAYEPDLLGSAGTIWANRDWLEHGETFCILYADNLTDLDVGRMAAFHQHHEFPFTLGVFRASEPERCGIAEVNAAGVVTDFVEKPKQPKSNLAAAGVYIADTRIFEYFPEATPKVLDLGFDILPRLIGQMQAYVIEELLLDVGTPESYA